MNHDFEQEQQANHEWYAKQTQNMDLDFQKDNANSLLKLFTFMRIIAIIAAIAIPVIAIITPWREFFQETLASFLAWSYIACGIICEILAILAIIFSTNRIKKQKGKLTQLEKELAR